MQSTHETDYGTVTITGGTVTVEAHGGQLYRWSTRSGAHWPCSVLADLDRVMAQFDETGLIDLEHPGADDLPADELTAWASDTIRSVLPASHPVHYSVDPLRA